MPLCLCFLLILILLLLQRSGTGLLASCCCAIATASLDLLPPARRPSLHSALGPSTRSTPGLLPQLIMPLIVGDSSKVVSRLMMLPILIRIILIVLVLVFFFPFHSILQFPSILSFHGRGPLPRAAYHGRFRLPTRPPPASSERPLQPVRSKLPPMSTSEHACPPADGPSPSKANKVSAGCRRIIDFAHPWACSSPKTGLPWIRALASAVMHLPFSFYQSSRIV
ncbi:hypothetical protein COCCADRAFT_26684 [Bipolaris zeicola 26-R-13]|uniref:Uncharacterized protein n=1 Tax=Cochliobolus carbonum (strain 26-R-13) TaxID=930089 RepID=W6Y5E3_COCC2|nr:uncharacterized protein COCCADRAFT_26684 [Bipolaris zeicola 26-R-13]EUC32870.1 hypothetical protein COCCADRAFT_26684 [Bipolaris zeicola 26-R-13]